MKLNQQQKLQIGVAYNSGDSLEGISQDQGVSRKDVLAALKEANVTIREGDLPVNHLPDGESFYQQAHEQRMAEILDAMQKQSVEGRQIPSAWLKELTEENTHLVPDEV